jgi:anti-anti-sigma factor
MELKVIERAEGTTYIKLSGSLDPGGVAEIETQFRALTSGTGESTILDMWDLDSVSPPGISLLVSCARDLNNAGTKIVIVNPQPAVENSLNQAGVGQIMPIVHSEQEALAAAGVASGPDVALT